MELCDRRENRRLCIAFLEAIGYIKLKNGHCSSVFVQSNKKTTDLYFAFKMTSQRHEEGRTVFLLHIRTPRTQPPKT